MSSLVKCLAIASILGAAFVCYDRTQDDKPMGGPPMPQPTEEHKWLAEGAGKWKATGKIMMGPTESMPMSGVQTNTMQQGGLWQLVEFKDDAGQFSGNGISGYDTVKKKFVSLWVDNMGSEFTPAEGTLSADKKTLTMKFQMTDKESGKKIDVTETIVRKDPKTALFEMHHAGPDGKSMKVLEITYTKM
jgi:hypothetical protein